MIIKKIILKDFRQYKGRQEIKFSTDSKRNVTVLLGLNTSGKTTIIEAFKWCLYDKTTYKKRDLINVQTEQDLGINENSQIYVEITLVHENIEYIVKRVQNYRKVGRNKTSLRDSRLFLSYKEKSGELKHIGSDDSQNRINRILPAELADYFFFDGERIGDIGNRMDIKNAVEGLMGLDVITEIKERLDPKRKNSVINKFETELDIGTDRNAEELTKNISEQQDKLEKYEKEMKVVEDEIKYYKSKFKKISDKIEANKSVGEKQKERRTLEGDLKKDIETLNGLFSRIRKNFIEKSFDYFAIPLVRKANNILNDTEKEVEGIVGMSAKSIDHIIDRGVCICGNDLIDNEKARDRVLDEKRLLPPYHIGTMVNEMKTSLRYIEDRGYNFKDDILLDFTRYEDMRKEIIEKEKTLENISKSLEGNINVGELEVKRSNYKEKIIELRNNRDIILRNTGASENTVKTLKKRKESLTISSRKNEEIKECIKYSEELFRIFTESYESQESIVKKALEDNVNKIFEEIYHGERFVRIDDNYKVSLDARVSDDMIETDLSKGLEAVKNFSFVAGLVKIAKEKLKNTEDISMEEPYPLIMDAPFSNVDEKHIANISRVLPEVSEQVIWILMEKDWNYAKESLIDKVGFVYDIEKEKNSETHSIVKGRIKYV